jgi:pilus assembly protein CpaB
LKTVAIREREVPKTAIVDENMAINRPLLYPVSASEPITSNKIASATGIEGLAATIEIGMRAITVPITDATGVAGMIPPRAHVDVLFTRPGALKDALTTTILENVVVLAIGRATESANSSTPVAAAGQTPRAAVTSATILATPEQSRKIELAKNLGKISLVLRNPLDHTAATDDLTTTSQDLNSILVPPPPPVRTVVMPAALTKPAVPPKPVREKLVEVFHGAQHVQEAFK